MVDTEQELLSMGNWSKEWCPHRDNDFPSQPVPDELRLHKIDCPDCLVAKLKALGYNSLKECESCMIQLQEYYIDDMKNSYVKWNREKVVEKLQLEMGAWFNLEGKTLAKSYGFIADQLYSELAGR